MDRLLFGEDSILRRLLPFMTNTSAPEGARWTKETVNADVLKASYAVRGPVLEVAARIEQKLQKGEALPFSSVIYCNIGNPQSLKQQPLTYIRQVLSLVIHPSLIKDAPKGLFPPDIIERAEKYALSQSMGAYSPSQGIKAVREEVAAFIEARDGSAADPEQIFLTNGASEGVRFVMASLLRGKLHGHNDGVLVPIPQYPLYSALTTLLNGELVPYYLDEPTGWALPPDELRSALTKARSQGVTVRGIVVINPGNPTGQLLSRQNMENIIQLCVEEKMVLLADEVYQANVYVDDRQFISFRKVAVDMGYDPKGSELQMVSFHSVSKGYLGECGLRGGYFELFGIDDDVKAQLYKIASISLCANTVGQIVTGLMVNPPKEGSPSYALFDKEKSAILASLRRRAAKLTEGLRRLEGYSVQASDGAMYSFPQISLPPSFVAEATAQGMKPDACYCLQVIEATGIVTVPGSGFGQKEGTYHFRTTFLPPEDKMDDVLARLSAFHAQFMDKYRA